MNCWSCKTELGAAANFCSHCGKKVIIESSSRNECSEDRNDMKCSIPVVDATDDLWLRCDTKTDIIEVGYQQIPQETTDNDGLEQVEGYAVEPEYQKMEKETTDTDGLERDEEYAVDPIKQNDATDTTDSDYIEQKEEYADSTNIQVAVETTDSDEINQDSDFDMWNDEYAGGIIDRLKHEQKDIVIKELQQRLDNIDTEVLKLGITGRSAMGKSSFINLILDLSPDDPDYAVTGAGDTTLNVKLYRHPKNNQFTISDMPGFGTLEMPKDKFLNIVNIDDYDFFFIFIDTVLMEDDLWIAKQLCERKVPFCFVRAKLDLYVNEENAKGIDKDKAIKNLREKITATLNKTDLLKECKLFLISNLKTYFHLGDLPQLFSFMEKSMTGCKAETFLFFLPILTQETVELKYNKLKTRVVLTSILAGLMGAIPIPGVDIVVNLVILSNELKRYVRGFKLDKDYVPTVPGITHPLSLRNVLSLNNLKAFVNSGIKSLLSIGVIVAASQLDIIIPVVGSVLSAGVNVKVSCNFLMQNLKELKNDALTVHHHFMSSK